jgi:hypothetical protein
MIGRRIEYKFFIPKSAITDFEALWKQTNTLATRYDQSQEWWWVQRGNEIIFCFENGNVAALFASFVRTTAFNFGQNGPKIQTALPNLNNSTSNDSNPQQARGTFVPT